jgi:hypothetical protein
MPKFNVHRFCQGKVEAGKMQGHLAKYHRMSGLALKRTVAVEQPAPKRCRHEKPKVKALMPAYSASESSSGKWFIYYLFINSPINSPIKDVGYLITSF